MEPCNTNHEQIMIELKRIQDRMDKDWELINAANIDRIRREGIWNVIKWVGFGGLTAILVHLL
jgi:hypothetical protein